MEMLPPAPVPSNVVVGATVVKRFPGYGERRGTIAEIDLDGGKVVVRWATDESTISLGEAAKWALYAIPPTEEEDDGDSTIAYDSGDDTAGKIFLTKVKVPQTKVTPKQSKNPRETLC